MLTLHVDAAGWRSALKSVAGDLPGLVPVAKGNGYGFGLRRLAIESALLGADTIAVGTMAEVSEVAAVSEFPRIIVLTPWHPGEIELEPGTLPRNSTLVRTVGSMDGLRALDGEPVVIECQTSLRRHGLGHQDLPALVRHYERSVIIGFAVHLPLDRPGGYDPTREVARWVESLRATALPLRTMYVSHLSAAEIETLRARYPGVEFRPRVGTRLWIGDRSTFAARASVLDVVPLRKGDRFGYRQRRARRAGHLLVASGGTAHGIGLEAPRLLRGPIARAKALAAGWLAALNRNRSPYSWNRRRLWFAEPPHMQVSLLWVPESVQPPREGDELAVDVRMTTTHFDRVVLE
ncbi:MAG TPA: alanine racemase [Actinomycetes bacterium]|nr:alanine racemase [Actinomycetes bacterium]